MGDSSFKNAKPLRRHHPGTAHTSTLNLPMVQRLQQQLESALGPEPILHAMLEQWEVNNPEKFDGLITADQRRRRLSQVLLEDSVNAISSTAQRTILFNAPQQEPLASIYRNSDSPQRQELTRLAQAATRPTLDLLQTVVNEESLHAPDRCAARQYACTSSVAISPSENLKFTAYLSARAIPGLCDERLPSGNIRYTANDGSHFSTITTPRRIIQAAEEGVIASEALNFPDGYRSRPGTT
ncbi:hypothetical protein [Actimicrobium sp. CCI2.3]|uniref:hypothetical protein n=1 Tax=Actimicrobium sp. CCI2.3 TaxID=3048616 RepID=UPI002AB45172|nr:hypothetical protein [Actimicrobium sp. CCI2.3]MDY7576109.1 hypothetical protein [Actimicrobium sp. CCI2.3]MEB0023488.1 hypothetical protein [Actimicrobium sp. CCI2.3]